MQKKSSTKSIIIAVAAVILLIFGYFYFSGTPEDTSSQLTADALGAPASDATVQAARIITLLNQTKSLRIEPAFFESAVYRSLVDHTVPVVEQQVGKANPFFYTAQSSSAGSSRAQ